MSKNRFICKLLGLSLAMFTVSPSAFALSTEGILHEVTVERFFEIMEISSESQGVTLGDYINLESIRESYEFKSFVHARCETPELVDSALFLNLLERISEFNAETHSRQLKALKESLFRRLISLRSPEEFRSDKFIVSDFDEYFSSNVKTIFKQFCHQSSSRSKMHRKARYETSEELYIKP